jgi:hypothetical protein
LFDILRRRSAPARRSPKTQRKNSWRRWQPLIEKLEDRTVPSTSSIVSTFNATAIPSGDKIWFSSVANVSGVATNAVNIFVTNQTISFSDTLNGTTTNYSLTLPNAVLTLSASATTATTSFNTSLNQWVTTAPTGLSGTVFLSGYTLALPSGLHGGNNPVTWSANFTTDTTGVSLNWQWAAAAYSSFGSTFSLLGVKPCDSNTASSYLNSDHAGTPESYKTLVTGGARGGGGSNYTGSYSATAAVAPTASSGFISGFVYNDIDSDGQRQSGESGLSGWTVQLYTQTAGVLTSSPIATTTSDALGGYSFSGLGALPVGTTYVVADVVPNSWQQTGPTSLTGTTLLPTGQRAYVYPASDGSDVLSSGGTNTSISGTGTLKYNSNVAGVSGSVSANDGIGDAISNAATTFSQLAASFTPSGGTAVSFNTFCIDLFHSVSIGQSLSTYVSGNESTAFVNGSRMAYIYDMYGTQSLSGSPNQAAAVQLALWDLSLNNHTPTTFAVDADGTYSSGDESVFSVTFNSATDAANVAPLVNQYLQASIGSTMQGGWLNAAAAGTGSTRGQSMPFPSPMENFGNHQQPPITISGTVYEDKMATGSLASGDPGIAGATLTLTGTNTLGQSITATAVSGANGIYTFTTDNTGQLLIAGTYQITETPPPGYLLAYSNVGSLTNTPVNWSLDFGQGVSGNGPGYAPDAVKSATDNTFTGGGTKDTSGIGGWLWSTGQPQQKDDLEHGFGAVYADPSSGHTLMLMAMDRYSASGDSVMGLWAFQNTISQNSNGTFNGGHKDGDLLLTIDMSTQAVLAYRWTGTDASGTLTPITLPAGSVFTNVPTGPVSVPWSFTDSAGQTAPQTGEFMQVGLDLTQLLGANIPAFKSLLTETRASNSATSTLSDYVIGGYNAVTGIAPSDGSVVSPTVIGSVVVPGGETGVGYNFGNIKAITVGGTVYQDSNGNNLFDAGEPGIAGVTVTLSGTNDKGQSITNTTTTAANGAYSFSTDSGGNLLRPGTYQIVETQPSGYLAGATTVGTVNGTADGTMVVSGKIGSIALAEGQGGINYNFGNLQPVTLSGTVYEDTNGNGAFDVGEPGIAGVTVTLSGTNGLGQSIIATTTTAANGTYSLSTDSSGNVLRPGSYTITETAPSGYLLGSAAVGTVGGSADGTASSPTQISAIGMSSGQSGINYNFGDVKAVTLSGLVYQDTNGNNALDAGEPGIAGVTITLTGTNGMGQSITATAVTAANGTYSFSTDSSGNALRPGTYVITESAPSGFLLGAPAVGTVGGIGDGNALSATQIGSIALTSGQSGVNYNFGDVKAVTLGGLVYQDTNGNNALNSGEPGIAGVTVTLTGTNNLGQSITATAVTAANGTYSFSTDSNGNALRPGTYVITETAPSGYLLGAAALGTVGGSADGVVTSTTKFSSIALTSGQVGINYNFGDVLPVTLSGLVYQDSNGNNALDSGEPGIAGVTVTLTGTNGLGQSITATATTAANGTYSFSTDSAGNALRPGTYVITETAPSGYLLGAAALGTVGGSADGVVTSTTKFSSIALTSGQVGVNYNFGDVLPVTLSGLVYQDSNGNNALDSGEPGIAGVTVTLTGTNGLGQSITATATTAANGTYSFSTDSLGNALRPGTYVITETAPSGYLLGAATLGTVGGSAVGVMTSATKFSAIALTSGQSGVNYNFGDFKAVTLSGLVYQDSNGNNALDAGEPGIAGVTVTLTGANGLGQSITATTTTAAGGAYSFSTDSSGNVLRPGSYVITETAPSGYLVGAATVGTVGGSADGTAASATQIGSITMMSGQSGVNYNFGDLKAVTLGGLVYEDTNGNGALNTGEPGIAGVTVTLTGTNGLGQSITATATTAANGTYSFSTDSNGNVLRPGTYGITETAPGGYLVGSAALGTVGGSADGVVTSATRFSSIALTSGQSGINYNFGDVKAITLGGLVYQDTNGNGALNSGEPGIAGVTVTLSGTNNLGQSITATTTTAADGTYIFSTDSGGNALRPGSYTISETAPAGYLLGSAALGTVGGSADGVVTSATRFSSIALTSGQTGINYNFGDVLPVTLSGQVYQDTNGNNALNSGEPGIAGVTITLTGTNGLGQAVTTTTTTAADGTYSFSSDSAGNALRPGTYVITETAPSGYLLGAATVGTVNGSSDGVVTSGTKLSAIALTSGQSGINYNFGDLKAVTLAGTVYRDVNVNGVYDAGDTAIAGVTMTLTGTNGLGQAVNATTTTAAGGTYSFSTDSSGNVLRPGTYQIVETQPSGYLAEATTVGTVNGTAVGTVVSTTTISSIGLTSGQAGINYNFGAVKPVTISGTVYVDTNGNGAFDTGEPGISGVTITLSGTNDKGQSITNTTTTAANGTYSFSTDSSGSVLRPGTYQVVETQPSGYLAGTTAVGTVNGAADGTVVATGTIGSIVMGDGQTGVTYLFGQVKGISISGTVYDDSNGSATFDSGDAGIAGVTLTLTGTNNLGQSITATTTTAADGSYSFSTDSGGNALRPGSYSVAESSPTGYLQGTNAVGTVNGQANGALVLVNKIGNIAMTSGQSGINYNFGWYKPVTISGTAYLDNNSDGVYGAGDSAFANVTLTLTGTNGQGHTVTATTTTAANGTYSFTTDSGRNVLLPGTYQITETVPSGYVAFAANLGTVNGVADGKMVSASQLTTIALTSGQSGINYNFGLSIPVAVAGYVYIDYNDDGVMNAGDAGYSGAKVEIVGTAANGQGVDLTTTTDANGHYIFSGLIAGTYSVILTPPGGYYNPEVANVGTVNGAYVGVATSILEIDQIHLGSGDIGVNYDFGGTFYTGLPS